MLDLHGEPSARSASCLRVAMQPATSIEESSACRRTLETEEDAEAWLATQQSALQIERSAIADGIALPTSRGKVRPQPNEPSGQLSDATAEMATIIAMAVRSGLEEVHGGDIKDSLTDEQMAKINPIVRNTIATMLRAFEHLEHRAWEFYVDCQERLVPSCWERPELLRWWDNDEDAQG